MPTTITDSFDAKKEKQVCKHQPKILDRLRTALRTRHYSNDLHSRIKSRWKGCDKSS